MSQNPYESPAHAYVPGNLYRPVGIVPRQATLGGFVLTVVIMDLVFCVLRLLMGLLAIVGYYMLPEDDPVRQTAVFEVVASSGIGVFGILANALILSKKRIGIPLAAISVLFTVLSIFVGAWQASLKIPTEMGTPETTGLFVGFLVGVFFGIVIRIGLLILYIVAVVQASKRLAQMSIAEAQRFPNL